MKFSVTVILLGLLMIQSTQGRTSCGSLLIDFLEVACGTNGIRSGWSSRMAMKYPNLQGRVSRHIQLPVPEHLLLQMVEMISEETADDLANDSDQIGKRALSEIASPSRRKRRTRRDIVKMCCYNRCTLKTVRRLYCSRS